MPIRTLAIRSPVFLCFLSVLGISFGASRPAAETQERERDALEQEFRQSGKRLSP